MSKPRTLSVSDMGGGIDRRNGIFSRDSSVFYNLTNYETTEGRKLRRRSPLKNVSGQFGENTKGLRFANGKLCVIAQRGETVENTISEYQLRVLYFDPPDGSSGEWEIIDFKVFGTKPVALIRHSFPSTVLPKRCFVHVWDDKHPTYVTDGACPASWDGDLPLHPFGNGVRNNPSSYQPRLTVAGNRVWVSMGDGNIKGSAVNRPRTWTQRTVDEILSEGDWYYYITSSNAPTIQTITIPLPYSDFIADQRYAAYLLELCTESGDWVSFEEVSNPNLPQQYALAAIANPWDTVAPAITQVRFNLPGDAQVVRFRAIAKPPVEIQNGLYLNVNGTVLAGTLTHEGNGHLVNSYIAGPTTPGQSYYVVVKVPNAPIIAPTAFAGSPGAMPLNGMLRYWTRIISVVTASTSPTAFLYAITGTVSVEVASLRVVGVGTNFQTELEVGRIIEVNAERRVVRSISSPTELEVESPFTATISGATALRDPRYRYASEVGSTGNTWYAEREADAAFNLAGNNDAVLLPTAVLDPEGNVPVSITATQSRLLLQFPSTIQLWGIDPDVNSIRQLSVIGHSSGTQTRPDPVLVDGWVVIPTSAGVRMFAPDGELSDYIKFAPIGDKLSGIAVPDLTRAVWWHHRRLYITASSDGSTVWAFAYHPEVEVAAWHIWTFAGMPAIDEIITAGDDLIIRSGRTLKKMSAVETGAYRDSDGPYVSVARWQFNDMGRPSNNKRLTRMDLYQVGSCVVRVFMNPRHTEENALGPVVSGRTIGLQKVPMAVMGPGIALELESSDESGHQVEQIDIDYMLLNR